MLYNVLILNGVALTVSEYNPHCVPCNTTGMLNIPFSETKIIKVDVPKTFKSNLPRLEAIKQYINLNNLV